MKYLNIIKKKKKELISFIKNAIESCFDVKSNVGLKKIASSAKGKKIKPA